MKAAVYLRVSSKDGRQDEANQEPDCARLCAARGWDPVFYREQESGAKKRPVWAAVLEAARRGEVGAVVFWALDRTGRTRVQVAHDLGELCRWNVAVTSVQDGWLDQPPGPLRDLLLQIMGWVAEGERRRLIERTRAGLDRAKAQGRKGGRPRTSPAAAERVLSARGKHPTWGLKAIARATGVPKTTVKAILARGGAENVSQLGDSKVA